jgi:hypothetical protein
LSAQKRTAPPDGVRTLDATPLFSPENAMPETPIEERLAAYHAHYVWRINAAIAGDQMDLVRDLAGEYEDETLGLMLALEGSTTSGAYDGAAEILEFGCGTQYWQGGRHTRPRFRFWRRAADRR